VNNRNERKQSDRRYSMCGGGGLKYEEKNYSVKVFSMFEISALFSVYFR
jgi:hypothetical protein